MYLLHSLGYSKFVSSTESKMFFVAVCKNTFSFRTVPTAVLLTDCSKLPIMTCMVQYTTSRRKRKPYIYAQARSRIFPPLSLFRH